VDEDAELDGRARVVGPVPGALEGAQSLTTWCPRDDVEARVVAGAPWVYTASTSGQ
jgi:hypothetical protein